MDSAPSPTSRDTIALDERLSPRHRPADSPIGYHRWRDLLFVHWRVPPQLLRPVVPRGLEIDTWDGAAWLGIVAFDMQGVRPWWSPSVPGVSAFHETNLRTYVHVAGRGPGVYFISLDAASSLAVRIARWRWNLPYYRATMSIERRGNRRRYVSNRRWPAPRDAMTDIEAELDQDAMPADRCRSGNNATAAAPGTLEFFLAERYLLYVESRRGELQCGQVHHTPYTLQSARLLRCEEMLSRAAGISLRDPSHPVDAARQAAPCHVMYSPGVDVDVFALRPASWRPPTDEGSDPGGTL